MLQLADGALHIPPELYSPLARPPPTQWHISAGDSGRKKRSAPKQASTPQRQDHRLQQNQPLLWSPH